MGKLRISDLTALLGAVLLFVATFLSWFELPGVEQLRELAPNATLEGVGTTSSLTLNVWDLGITRWFVYLAIGLAFCMILAALLSRTAEWAVILATPLVIVSFFALLGMVIRLFDSPRPYSEAMFGFYLGLAGSIVLFAGAFWAIRDESVPDGFDKAPSPEQLRVSGGS